MGFLTAAWKIKTPAQIDLMRLGRSAGHPGTTRVAGHDAYEIALVPKSDNTLVGEVRIAIDAQNYEPFSVQVLAKNVDKPAFEVAYTSVSFETPAPSTFDFTPPSGATVDAGSAGTSARLTLAGSKRNRYSTSGHRKGLGRRHRHPETRCTREQPTRKGEPRRPTGHVPEVGHAGFGAFGSGKLVHTVLLNVVVLDDGRIAVGSVGQTSLLNAIPHA